MSGQNSTGRSVQWFPGHMAAALKQIEKDSRLVDGILMILDARCPQASMNRDLLPALRQKPVLILLNKCDLADPDLTERWRHRFIGEGRHCIAVNSRDRRCAASVREAAQKMLQPLAEKRRAKNLQGEPFRLMAVGIPNVGKSTLLNNLANARRAKAEDRPGVTTGKQWVSVPGLDLLDEPGIMPKKVCSEACGICLALTGSIPDDLIDREAMAVFLLDRIRSCSPGVLETRYRLAADAGETGYALLEQAARNRGMLLRGGEADTERAAKTVLDEFRGGLLGRISLEEPEDLAERTGEGVL